MRDLTVVVPVWDRYVHFLPDCVEAIVAQGVESIVVVDNASCEPLPSLTHAARIVRLKVRRTAGGARNAGLERVRTPFVCFVDVDDRVVDGAWSLLLETMRSEADVVAAAAQPWWVDAESGVERPASSPRAHVYGPLNGRSRLLALYLTLRMALPTTTTTIFRTRVVTAAGGYADTSYAEDWQLALSIAVRGRIKQYRRPGARVLIHNDSLFNRPRSRSEISTALRELRERGRRDPEVPPWLKLTLFVVAPFHELKAALTARRPAFGNWSPR